MIEIIKTLLRWPKALIGFYCTVVAFAIYFWHLLSTNQSFALIMFTALLCAASTFVIGVTNMSLPAFIHSQQAKIIPHYRKKIKSAMLWILLVLHLPALFLWPDHSAVLMALSHISLLGIALVMAYYQTGRFFILATVFALVYVIIKTKAGDYIQYFGYLFPIMAYILYQMIKHIDRLHTSEKQLQKLKGYSFLVIPDSAAMSKRIDNLPIQNLYRKINIERISKLLKDNKQLSKSQIIEVMTFNPNGIGFANLAALYIMIAIFFFIHFLWPDDAYPDAIRGSYLGFVTVSGALIPLSFQFSYDFYVSIKGKFKSLRATPLYCDRKILRLQLIKNFMFHNFYTFLLYLILLVTLLITAAPTFISVSFVMSALAASVTVFLNALGLALLFLHAKQNKKRLYGITVMGLYVGIWLIGLRLVKYQSEGIIGYISGFGCLLGLLLCLWGYWLWYRKEPS